MPESSGTLLQRKRNATAWCQCRSCAIKWFNEPLKLFWGRPLSPARPYCPCLLSRYVAGLTERWRRWKRSGGGAGSGAACCEHRHGGLSLPEGKAEGCGSAAWCLHVTVGVLEAEGSSGPVAAWRQVSTKLFALGKRVSFARSMELISAEILRSPAGLSICTSLR